jgi:hypothetical protein
MAWRIHAPDMLYLSRPQLRLSIVSAAIPLVFYFVVTQLNGVATSRAMYVVEFAILAYLSAVFRLFQRSQTLAVVPFIAAACGVYAAAVQKYALLGIWVRYGDVYLLGEAWRVLSEGEHLAVAATVIVVIGLGVYNFRLPHRREIVRFMIPAVLCLTLSYLFPGQAAGLLLGATHARFGNDPLYRGPLFAVGLDVIETWRFERESDRWLARFPDHSAPFPSGAGTYRKRNVHIFVMESFMDPSLLGVPLSQDPIDPRLRALVGGSSLSPVFGGRSAQPEFEILCGTPVYDYLNPVTFNDLHGEPLPCLPNLLREYGYETAASQDVPPNFFNAQVAYRSVGITHAHYQADMPKTDMDGIWVSAEQQIEFNKRLIGPWLKSGQPFLNYVFFNSGHIPYEMNPARRPPVIKTASSAEVTRFVNAIYYNSRALADYLDFLATADPSSVIVMVGDHQGVLSSIGRTKEGADNLDRYRTPYVFIDAGEVRHFGDIAHYQIPGLILAGLTGRPTPRAPIEGVDTIRPFKDQVFYEREGEILSCPNPGDRLCLAVQVYHDQTVADWLRLIRQSQARN